MQRLAISQFSMIFHHHRCYCTSPCPFETTKNSFFFLREGFVANLLLKSDRGGGGGGVFGKDRTEREACVSSTQTILSPYIAVIILFFTFLKILHTPFFSVPALFDGITEDPPDLRRTCPAAFGKRGLAVRLFPVLIQFVTVNDTTIKQALQVVLQLVSTELGLALCAASPRIVYPPV